MDEKIATGRHLQQWRVGALHVTAEHHCPAAMVDPVRTRRRADPTDVTRRSPCSITAWRVGASRSLDASSASMPNLSKERM
ncbi:MAG: hypothetical protein M3Y17_12380 [Actinomycetota bacterium]|nr:hypothetical protein [Actinomycetota bacterium]